jgi:single-stranded-DNA-specific exonuclease
MTDADAILGVTNSLMGRAWMARPIDSRQAMGISQKLGVPEIVGRVLAARGQTMDSAELFLNPTLKEYMPDPSVLKDMDKATTRVLLALQNNENIVIFGDYDVDGATSSALLVNFLSAVGATVKAYIPDRLTEGYGPNTAALLKLKEEGASLVITVDCGILSYEPLQAARDAGLDVIVVDHHKAETELPAANAVINPNRLDDDSGLGHVAAVGVAFLFAVSINRELRSKGWYRDDQGRAEPNLKEYLDIVALGTVCDVVPLVGLNRAFVTQGLKVMAGRRNVGLRALSDISRLDKAPDAYHLGFMLGPRVNAGGRVGESPLGSILLSCTDDIEAQNIAVRLDGYNTDRKFIEAEVQDAAMALAMDEAQNNQQGNGKLWPIACIAGEGWHPGVIGIVASRIKDKFNVPSIIIALEKQADGSVMGKGSARSIMGVDLGAAIIEAKHKGLLVAGGGHAMAAGLTIEADKIPEFKDFISEQLSAQVVEATKDATLNVDGVLTLKGANADLVDKINAVGPFGVGNSAARFAFADCALVKVDLVGADHVRCIFASSDGGTMKVMAFKSAHNDLGGALLAGKGRKFHLVGKIKRDDWMGQNKVEMMLDDAAPAP